MSWWKIHMNQVEAGGPYSCSDGLVISWELLTKVGRCRCIELIPATSRCLFELSILALTMAEGLRSPDLRVN